MAAKKQVVFVILLLHASIILAVGTDSACSSCQNEAMPTEEHAATHPTDLQINTNWNGSIEVNVQRLRHNLANFTWDVTPTIPEGLHVFVRFERKYSWCPQLDFVSMWDIKEPAGHLPLTLQPAVYTRVTVKVGNVTDSANITAPATVPRRKVESLTCGWEYCEAAVQKNCSSDDGPNIHVKFVLDAWNGTLQRYSPVKTVDSNITKNFVAKVDVDAFDLLPLTQYRLTAYSANSKGKSKAMSSSKKIFTTSEVANVVSRLLEEDNQIQLSWELYMLSYFPNPWLSKQEVFFVSLCHQECVDMPVTTNYTMIIPLDELAVGTQYIAKIKACVFGTLCSAKAEVEMWTPPEEPTILQNDTDTDSLPGPTTNTITVRLPVLLNPPGWHWVLLKISENKEGQAWYKTLQDRAIETVQRNQSESSLSPDRNSTEETSFRIVKKVPQDKQHQKKIKKRQVTVGETNPLQNNTRYTVVVVTETRAGNNSKYYASAPQIYKTKTDVHPASAMGMIAGMCGAAVLGAVLAVTLWMKFRERRGRQAGVAPMQRVLPGGANTSF